MKRPVSVALLFGLVNAVIAVVALALVEVATPDDFDWYAYVPLDEVVVNDPRFPWHYVVVPLALFVSNVVVLRAYLSRTAHK